MSLNSADLTSYLHQQIPLTSALKVSVEQLSDEHIALQASFAPNRNDKATAFGGSMAALMTLAGWSLLTHRLDRRGLSCEVVIQKQRFSYLSPVTEDLIARCTIDEIVWKEFESALRDRGKARVPLSATIAMNDVTAATMQAKYVALVKE